VLFGYRAENAFLNVAQKPLDALRTPARAYVGWAKTKPARFKLTFGPWNHESPELRQAAAESRTLLVLIVASAQARFELPQGDPQGLAALVLALAHGAVDQALAGHLSASGKGGADPEDLCDDLLNYLIQSAAPQGQETKVRHMTKANEGPSSKKRRT
jgi:hypothetical protein